MKLHWAFLVNLSEDQPMKISAFCDRTNSLSIAYASGTWLEFQF